MDSMFPDWSSEIGVEFPLPIQRKSLRLDNELVELSWQNGEVVLQSQSNRRQSDDPSKTIRGGENLSNLIRGHENLGVSWMDCPTDESFGKEFCANLLPEISPIEKGASDFTPLLSPHPYFESFEPKKASNAVERGAFSGAVGECSAKTIGSSNGVGNRSCVHKVSTRYECMEMAMGTLEQVITSSSCKGSDSACWKTGSLSNDTNRHKRKSRDVIESECPSDATELESGTRSKPSSQKSRRSRVAEVHNMSERRRRDRINEKMKALQGLIPHSNKSDKASMLDEAIEYMKSLQLQLQLLWMGSRMTPMMFPGMQPYMSRMGVLPAIQNLMRLSRMPLVDPAMTMSPSPNQATLGQGTMFSSINYHNQMQNLGYPEQYANYMGFSSMPNGPQATNTFNYGHSAQQNHTFAPQPDSNLQY